MTKSDHTTYDTVITGGTLVSETGRAEADVAILDGRIESVTPRADEPLAARETIDASGLYVLPGVIDPHAHIGFGGPDDWRTETESAATGGVTTVLNYVMGPSSYLDQVAAERETADRESVIDYGLHIVPCNEQHLDELEECVGELGIKSCKFFMNFRGDEGAYLGVEGTDDGYLFDYFRRIARHPGVVANIHPENIEIVWKLRPEVRESGLDGLKAWDASRPDYVEAEPIYRAAFYADVVGAPLYIVHLSADRGLREIHRARDAFSTQVWVETCPHYLTHTVESSVGSLGKVNPPLRTSEDREALWAGLRDGTIDTVGSDHVGRPRSAKEADIWKASAGMPGMASILSVLLSEGVHKRGLTLEQVVRLTSTNAARIFGLYPKKGTISRGSDADLVLVDLDEERTVDADTWKGGSGYTLYEGWTLKGWPVMTMSRGEIIAGRGASGSHYGHGQYVRGDVKAAAGAEGGARNGR